MGLFKSILEKLGLKKDQNSKTPAASATPQVSATKVPPVQVDTPNLRPAVQQNLQPVQPIPAPIVVTPASEPKPVPMEKVDVVKKLNAMASDKGEKLDWKKSIVDLLKVLSLDSSVNARKELAVELGCPEELMNDRSNEKMNIWLHKTVLEKIAENGGNIPEKLLNK